MTADRPPRITARNGLREWGSIVAGHARCVIAVAVIASFVTTFSGCGSARRGVPLTGEHRLDTAELQLGHRIFDMRCGPCHPGGSGGLAPAINNKPVPGFVIRFQVRRGFGAMPSFSDDQLSDEELSAVVSYLKYVRRLDVL